MPFGFELINWGANQFVIHLIVALPFVVKYSIFLTSLRGLHRARVPSFYDGGRVSFLQARFLERSLSPKDANWSQNSIQMRFLVAFDISA